MSTDFDAGLEKVRATKAVAEQIFAKLLGDVAIGITRVAGNYALKVNLASPPDPSVSLPSTVNGVAVSFEVTGPVSKRIARPESDRE